MTKSVTFEQCLAERELNPKMSEAQIFESAWAKTPEAKKIKRNKKVMRYLILLALSSTGTFASLTLIKSLKLVVVSEVIDFVADKLQLFLKLVEAKAIELKSLEEVQKGIIK